MFNRGSWGTCRLCRDRTIVTVLLSQKWKSLSRNQVTTNGWSDGTELGPLMESEGGCLLFLFFLLLPLSLVLFTKSTSVAVGFQPESPCGDQGGSDLSSTLTTVSTDLSSEELVSDDGVLANVHWS
jgi:hypothetical protein